MDTININHGVANTSGRERYKRGHALRLATCMLVLTTAGCGGGGDAAPGTMPALNSAGSGPSSPTNPGNPTAPGLGLTLTLKGSAASASTTTIALDKPLSVTATVVDEAGKPAANALLAVAVDPQLLAMRPARGQVATDANGKATLTLAPAGITASGATQVTVLAQYGSLSTSAQAVVTVAAPSLTFSQVAPLTSPAPVGAYGATLVALDILNDGAPLTSQSVTLNLRSACSDAGRASLPASVTTVQGRAQFTYQDKGCAQPDSIAATIDGGSTSTTVAVTPSSPDAASIVLGDITPSDKSIVIQGAGGSGRTELAQVSFRVIDKNGAPVANQSVSFSTISTKSVRLSQASATTDGNGIVSVELMSGTEPTAVRVVASLPNGLSTVSDSVTITTGLPVQLSLSLSAHASNIEGYDYDDVTDEIKLLLADQFSNPVADGVPVVLQTDSGSIGTSGRGGCTTDNGRCTVDLRSQNPRYGSDATAPRGRAGLATITATTLSGSSVPLSGEIAVFLSGSTVSNLTLVGTPGTAAVANKRIAADAAGCSAVNVAVRISDVRRNPMPTGSSLTFDSAVSMSGIPYPASVPSVAPTYTNGAVTGDQGSVHTLALLPDPAVCDPAGSITVSASANLVVTTPFGNASVLPITLRYKRKPDAQ
jgi:hypothetical protein